MQTFIKEHFVQGLVYSRHLFPDLLSFQIKSNSSLDSKRNKLKRDTKLSRRIQHTTSKKWRERCEKDMKNLQDKKKSAEICVIRGSFLSLPEIAQISADILNLFHPAELYSIRIITRHALQVLGSVVITL